MTKYLFLYNVDVVDEKENLDTLKKLFPDIRLYDYGYTQLEGKPKKHKWEESVSVWIPKKQFIAAHLIFNLVPDFEYADEITVEHAIRALEDRLQHKEYIKKL